MSWIGFVVALGFFLYQVIKEASQKPLPRGSYFDKEAEYQDLKNGVPYSVRRKKIERMEYWVKPGDPNYDEKKYHGR